MPRISLTFVEDRFVPVTSVYVALVRFPRMFGPRRSMIMTFDDIPSSRDVECFAEWVEPGSHDRVWETSEHFMVYEGRNLVARGRVFRNA